MSQIITLTMRDMSSINVSIVASSKAFLFSLSFFSTFVQTAYFEHYLEDDKAYPIYGGCISTNVQVPL